MSTDNEMYDQILTDLLNDTLKHGFAKAAIITPKKKIYGSRRAIRRVLKARKEKEQGK
jgi:hypothetical protein